MTGQVIGAFVDVGVIFKVFKLVKAGRLGKEIGNLIERTPGGKNLLDGLDKTKKLAAAGAALGSAAAGVAKVSFLQNPAVIASLTQLGVKTETFDSLVAKKLEGLKNKAAQGAADASDKPKTISGTSKVGDGVTPATEDPPNH